MPPFEENAHRWAFLRWNQIFFVFLGMPYPLDLGFREDGKAVLVKPEVLIKPHCRLRNKNRCQAKRPSLARSCTSAKSPLHDRRMSAGLVQTKITTVGERLNIT